MQSEIRNPKSEILELRFPRDTGAHVQLHHALPKGALLFYVRYTRRELIAVYKL